MLISLKTIENHDTIVSITRPEQISFPCTIERTETPFILGKETERFTRKGEYRGQVYYISIHWISKNYIIVWSKTNEYKKEDILHTRVGTARNYSRYNKFSLEKVKENNYLNSLNFENCLQHTNEYYFGY